MALNFHTKRMSKIIGIDLGTTNSVVAVMEGDQPTVIQNAEDRVDTDPQLRHLKWLTEVTGTKIGTWPVYEIPMKLSRTPAYIGGPINRGAPCYGEDNMYVLTELLGRTPSEVERLAEEGVI